MTGHDVGQWAALKLEIVLSEPYVAFGWLENDEPRCAIVFNHYSGTNIDIHCFCPGLITREIVRTSYRYAFETAGVVRVTSITKRSNKPMLRLLPRLGFTYESTAKNLFGLGRDGIINRLDRQNAEKWMN